MYNKQILFIGLMAVLLGGCVSKQYSKLFHFAEFGCGGPPVFVTIVDGAKQPVEGIRLRIRSQEQPYEAVTNSHGVVEIPVTKELFAENPPVWIDGRNVWTDLCLGTSYLADSVAGRNWGWKSEISFIVKSGNPEKSLKRETVPVEGKCCLADADLKLFYDEGNEELAHGAMAEIIRHRDAIGQFLGIKPRSSWTLILVPETKPDTMYIGFSDSGKSGGWVYDLEAISSGSFAGTNVHEWTEMTLMDELEFYKADRRNRIFGDGLAEYASFCIAGMDDSFLKRLECLDEGTQTLDLTKQFMALQINIPDAPDDMDVQLLLQELFSTQGFPPGYSLSFAFWHELCEIHGSDLPAKFVKEVLLLDNRDFDACLAVLERLCGETDLRSRLESADVNAARERIKRLMAEAGQGDTL